MSKGEQWHREQAGREREHEQLQSLFLRPPEPQIKRERSLCGALESTHRLEQRLPADAAWNQISTRWRMPTRRRICEIKTRWNPLEEGRDAQSHREVMDHRGEEMSVPVARSTFVENSESRGVVDHAKNSMMSEARSKELEGHPDREDLEDEDLSATRGQ